MTRTHSLLAEYASREARVMARRLAAVGLADGCPVLLPASAFDLPGGDLAFDSLCVMRPTMQSASGSVTQHNSPRVARPTEGSL